MGVYFVARCYCGWSKSAKNVYMHTHTNTNMHGIHTQAQCNTCGVSKSAKNLESPSSLITLCICIYTVHMHMSVCFLQASKMSCSRVSNLVLNTYAHECMYRSHSTCGVSKSAKNLESPSSLITLSELSVTTTRNLALSWPPSASNMSCNASRIPFSSAP